MIKTSKITVLLIAVSFLALPVVVHAENGDESNPWGEQLRVREERMDDRQEKIKENMENRQEKTEERKSNRCEIRKNAVDNRVKMFRVSERFHKEKYTRIYERLSSLVERLDAQGVDTSKLKSDLATLKGEIDSLKATYDTLMSKLDALKDVDCENTESNEAALEEIRGLLKDLKEDAQDIREFFVNTIKPDLQDLQDLRDQKMDKSESEDN